MVGAVLELQVDLAIFSIPVFVCGGVGEGVVVLCLAELIAELLVEVVAVVVGDAACLFGKEVAYSSKPS